MSVDTVNGLQNFTFYRNSLYSECDVNYNALSVVSLSLCNKRGLKLADFVRSLYRTENRSPAYAL